MSESLLVINPVHDSAANGRTASPQAAGFLDKGKPPARVGRKAMGPSGIARLPKGLVHPEPSAIRSATVALSELTILPLPSVRQPAERVPVLFGEVSFRGLRLNSVTQRPCRCFHTDLLSGLAKGCV